MVVLPAISAVIALACAALIVRDTIRQPKPDRIAWILAFAMFAVAAGAEVLGETVGWSASLARLFYLTGVVLVVGFLAIGQLYLLAPARVARVGPGIAMLLTAISVSTVLGAPVDSLRLNDDGWGALTRTTGLKILAIGINSTGTLILIGGLVYSAIRFRQLGTMRNRMIGCLLIAGGTLTVATGGTLTRLGSRQYLYVAMSVGISLIFGGYLWTRRPDVPEIGRAVQFRDHLRRQRLSGAIPAGSPALAHIQTLLLNLDAGQVSEECRVWSVPGREIDAYNRVEARRVWSFRNRLGPDGQARFDAFPIGVRLQLTDLYLEVLTTNITNVEWGGGGTTERGSLRDGLTTIPTTRASVGSVD